MKINAMMERKAPRILTDSYTVGDVIVLTEKEYFSLYNNLLRDRDYFEERKHNTCRPAGLVICAVCCFGSVCPIARG